MLGERKRIILQAIINDYINTGEPVGSRTIAKKYELGLSSATIRNEMADLEEMGYLMQPHTSAGRIPSDNGYRLYVDELMEKYRLTTEEEEFIKYSMHTKRLEFGRLIEQVSNIISELTHYPTVVLKPQINKSVVKQLQLIPVDEQNVLLVLITDTGIVKDKNIKFSVNVSTRLLKEFVKILNKKMSGLKIEDINMGKITNEIQEEIFCDQHIFLPILKYIFYSINDINESDIYTGGATNILNFPEYHDVCKLKDFLGFLEQKENICKLLCTIRNNDKIDIVIGNENKFSQIKDCSVVMSTYSLGDDILGRIGIIGPTRMRYSKVVSSLEYLTEYLNKALSEWFGYDKFDY